MASNRRPTAKSKQAQTKELPPWVLPVCIAAGVVLLGFIAWRALTGYSGAAGPVREVHPGMYDFRKEFQNGNVGRRHMTGPSGQTQ